MQEKIQIKNLDHLGLIAGMIDELGIVECIDEHIGKKSDDKLLSYGELVKAMILNGLGYVNKQLYLVPKFFSDKPLHTLFKRDVKAEWFNDDALGRTLDVLYQYGVSELYQSISFKAMNILGLTLKTLHLDSTSFHIDGEYNRCSNNGDDNRVPIKITKGYSRDHHPQLNQVVLNLMVEHQAGIPVWMKASNGNQIDTKEFATIVKEHIKAMKSDSLKELMLVSDAALFTKETLKYIAQNNIKFITRVPNKLKEAKTLLRHCSNGFYAIDDNYKAIETSIEYEGIKQRWILYKSTLASKREEKTVFKKLSKQSLDELNSLQKLSKKSFFCEEDAKAAFEAIKERLKSVQIVKATLKTIPKYKTRGRKKAGTKPDFYHYMWQFTYASNIDNFKNLVEEKSGLFILATNDLGISAKVLLDEYKSQQRVERGFRFLKSPEFLVDSLYLKKPERIESLLMIMTLSLMVYSALEYTIRKELKVNNETFPNQLKKPIQNPTAKWIFENFFAIHLLIMNNTYQIIGLNPLHRQILRLLGSSYEALYDICDSKMANAQ